MEIQELMTSDYVRHKKTKDIIKIFEIDNDRAVINNEADGYCSERNISINDIEPIPLIREILEKIGFVEKEFYSELIVGDFRIICDLHNVCIQRNGHVVLDAPIEYLHELQHAFRLCKNEKEIWKYQIYK